MTNLVLFCGGERQLNNVRLPKPLLGLNDKSTVLDGFLENTAQYFSKVFLLVEREFVQQFSKYTDRDVVELVPVSNGSTTMQKFDLFLKVAQNLEKHSDGFVFSYPDIFADKDFWSVLGNDDFVIKVIPMRSRFPKVSLEAFGKAVKGISSYDTRIPANINYVFGGFFYVRNLDVLMDSGSFIDFEYEYLGSLCNYHKLSGESYFGQWMVADGPRDYQNIVNYLNKLD